MMTLQLKKIIVFTISQVVMLVVIYMALMYFQFSRFGHETFAGCFELGLNSTELQYCMYEVLAYHINDSHWMAVQFVLLVVPSVLLAWVLTHRISHNRMTHVLFASSISSIVIWLVLTPPLIPALAAFTGIPLGGMMAGSRFFNKKPLEPADEKTG